MVRLHRWLAVLVGAMLPLWFATGTVLSFEPFPTLAGAARLAAGEPLGAAWPGAGKVFGSSCLAGATAAAATRVRLVAVDGAARWILRGPAGDSACDPATGRAAPPLDARQAARVAARFTGSTVRGVEGPLVYDAWTIHDGYRAARPWWRVALDDAEGTVLYVSARTGEAGQRTTARQRAWNQVGARLHWLNLGTLRASFERWRALMLGIATLALVLTLAGLALGVRRAWQARRLPRPRLSPFRGLLRRHHLAGLGGGLLVLAWLGSGWLSLDGGLFFSPATPAGARLAALQGLRPAAVAAAFVGLDPARLGAAREAEVLAFGGQPRLLLRDPSGGVRTLVPGAAGGTAAPALRSAELVAAVERAWAPHRVVRSTRVGADDPWALRGAPFPPATWRLRLDDPAGTWVHVDAASGEFVSAMDASRRRYRWLVDGLHRLDFPALNRSGAWHVLLLLGTASGLLFTLSGVLLATRRLSGSLRRTASRAGSAASGTAS